MTQYRMTGRRAYIASAAGAQPFKDEFEAADDLAAVIKAKERLASLISASHSDMRLFRIDVPEQTTPLEFPWK